MQINKKILPNKSFKNNLFQIKIKKNQIRICFLLYKMISLKKQIKKKVCPKIKKKKYNLVNK